MGVHSAVQTVKAPCSAVHAPCLRRVCAVQRAVLCRASAVQLHRALRRASAVQSAVQSALCQQGADLIAELGGVQSEAGQRVRRYGRLDCA